MRNRYPRRSRKSPPGPRALALARLGRWLATHRREIAAQVTVSSGRRGAEERTTVAIDHLLDASDVGLGRLRVYAGRTFLPLAHFTSEARHRVSVAANSASGRALYCEDTQSREVIAALAFHIDRRSSRPILITEIALRDDVGSNPVLATRTLEAGLVLKHYVHAVSADLDRDGAVDIDLADSRQHELMEELGFRPAPRLDGFRPGGTHLRQPAPVSRLRAAVGGR